MARTRPAVEVKDAHNHPPKLGVGGWLCSIFRSRSTTEFYVALALIVATQFLLAWSFGSLPGSQRSAWRVSVGLIALLAVPATVLIWAVWRTQTVAMTRVVMVSIAVAGVLMRLPYFGAGPMLEDDHFRYVLDGAMLAAGLNPYAYSPESLLNGTAPEGYRIAAAAGRQAIEQINFPDLRSIYPGTAQALFAIAHVIKPWSVDGLRVLLMACEAMTALLAWRMLGQMNLPRHFVALIWCNPLLAFSLTGQAHIDAALSPLILGALIAARRHAGIIAGIALGLAVGVKLWPALLALLVLRCVSADRRSVIGFVAAIGMTTMIVSAALALAATAPSSGLVAYARGWHINNMPYEWVSYAGYLIAGGAGLEPALRVVIGSASAAISIALAIRPIRDTADLVTRAAWIAAATFYLSPSQFPWYANWFLPLAALSRNWSLLVASASLPTYFLFFPLAGPVWGDLFRFWLCGLHLLPVVVIAMAIRSNSRKHTA